MLTAAFTYTVAGALVRHLSDEFSLFALALLRSVAALIIFLPPVLGRGGLAGIRTPQLGMHFVRAGFTYGGIMFWFVGVTLLPLPEYYALQFTLPLFTIAGAVLVLRERVGLANWIAVFVGFGGALIILRPGIIPVGVGALAALASALSYAGANITMRVLSRRDTVSVIVLLALGPAIYSWTTPTWEQLPWVVGMAVFGSIGQFCLTRAIALADARVVQPFEFARLPIAAMIGYFFFSESASLWTWIGALVIFGAGYFVLQHERRQTH
jgi:drug/metabolite transporter (DMT)-like permease